MLKRVLAALFRIVYFDYIGETIIGNCSCVLFLGGKEKSTLKEISETLGKATIDSYNTSDTRGSQRSMGVNYQKLGRALMDVDELAVMDNGKCILQVQGIRPFFSDKFDITKHPQYKYLLDFSKKNYFDIEKYLRRRLTVRLMMFSSAASWRPRPRRRNRLADGAISYPHSADTIS